MHEDMVRMHLNCEASYATVRGVQWDGGIIRVHAAPWGRMFFPGAELQNEFSSAISRQATLWG
eukprot:scaffold294239_cov17-Tisochrysis_lutea.AAC.1